MRSLRSIRGETVRSDERATPRIAVEGTYLTPRTATIICWMLAVTVGGTRAWATRYEVDTDIISYLDMADAYLRGDWFMALNGQWNPLYTWLLVLMQLLVRPDPSWEFQAVTGLGFAIYVAGLPCLQFFLHQLLGYNEKLAGRSVGQETSLIPPWAIFAFGYLLYIWTSLQLLSLHGFTGPDLCVANFLYLAFGLLLRIHSEASSGLPWALLGLVCGLGYLTKAIMLPLTFVFLVVGVCLSVDVKRAVAGGMLALGVFIGIAGPFMLALSLSKGRFTYSDTGRFNYAFFVCMGPPLDHPWVPPYLHWQGDIPGCGTPTHPTRKIHAMPAVYEFGTPFLATFGAWYDPSYWYEGVNPRVNVENQIRLLLLSLQRYINLFVRSQPALVMGFLFLAWIRWRGRYPTTNARSRLLVLVPIVAALSLYGLVHVENRFVGAHIAVFWLVLYTMGIRLPDSPTSRSLWGGVLGGIAALILFSNVLPKTWDDVQAIRLERNEANNEYVRVAKDLPKLGIQPGDHVACIGNAKASLWARLARVRITAQITPQDAPDYWRADTTTRRHVREILTQTGVKAIVTDHPLTSSPHDDSGSEWQQITAPLNQDKRAYYGSLLYEQLVRPK